MSKLARNFLVVFLPLFLLIFLCRDALFGPKIIFPSNYLVHLYAPWQLNVPDKPIGLDQVRFFYPLRTFVNQEISAGRLPLWNPHIFSGYPQLANLQSAVFYPLNALYLILPQIVAWSTLIILEPLLASIFTYLYLRVIRVNYWGALFGGLAFGFSAFMTVWSQENAVVGHTALWLPLMLLFVEKKSTAFLALTVATTIFAGHFQTAFYSLGLLAIYILFRRRFRALFGLILGISLASLQILPTLEVSWESVRAVTSAAAHLDTYLLPVSHFIRLLAPDITGNPGSYNFFGPGFYHETTIYVGIPALIFATISPLRAKNSVVLFFIVVFFVTILLTIKSPFTEWLYTSVPLVNTFLPSRILFLPTFALAILSGVGLSHFLTTSPNRKTLLLCFVAILISLMALAVQDWVYLEAAKFTNLKAISFVGIKNSLLPAGSLVIMGLLLIVRRWRKLFLLGTFALLLFNAGYFFTKYAALGEAKFLYPDHPLFAHLQGSRFMTVGPTAIMEDISLMYGLSSAEGLDPLFPLRYANLVNSSKNHGQLPSDFSRVEATFHELNSDEVMLDRPEQLKLMQIVGIKRVAYFSPDGSGDLFKIFPASHFSPVASVSGWAVFDYLPALSRPYLVTRWQIAKSDKEILSAIFSPNNNLADKVILEQEPGISPSNRLGKVATLKDSPQELTFAVTIPAAQLLVLSDNYFPGWEATLDGKPTKILRANYAFRAVVVPAGDHVVSFLYRPTSFSWGVLVSALAAIVLGLVWLYERKASRSGRFINR